MKKNPDQLLKELSPAEYIREVTKDYNKGYRTKHPEYDPPYNKIKEFGTK